MAFEIHNNKKIRILDEKERIEDFFSSKKKNINSNVEQFSNLAKDRTIDHNSIFNINKKRDNIEDKINYQKIKKVIYFYQKNQIASLIDFKKTIYKDLIFFLECKINSIKYCKIENFSTKYRHEIQFFLDKNIENQNFPDIIIHQILITKIYDIIRILNITNEFDQKEESSEREVYR